MNSQTTSNFDAAAQHYDTAFTYSTIGKLQRKRVYHWLNKIGFFNSSKHVFEINCGTGYDAIQFAKRGHNIIATDASAEMINRAKQREVTAATFYQLNIVDLKSDKAFKKAEVLFSNFGGLNCLDERELSTFLKDISTVQQKGNLFVGVVMAKQCFMEDLYHLLKFSFSKIGRRNNSTGTLVNVDGALVPTFYYSPKEIASLLSSNYSIKLIKPVALFLPPSYLEPFFKKHDILLRLLHKLEQVFSRFSHLAKFADHFILIAEKR